MIFRWINGGFFRGKTKSDEDNDNEQVEQCYICNQFGIPHFHSTSCDPAHQPAWEALAGSSLVPPIKSCQVSDQKRKSSLSLSWLFRPLDPRSEKVVRWSRVLLLARYLAFAVDPFFFFSLAMDDDYDNGRTCLYVDARVVRVVSYVRTCIDVMHLCHIWIQFRLAYLAKESMVVGCGRLVWDARDIALQYLRSLRGFWLDAFVLLPFPQIVYIWVLPILLRDEKISTMMVLIQVIFLVQYFLKIYHVYCLMQRSKEVTGYIFGSVWWRLGLSLIAYFLAANASGGYWYALAIRRVISCFVKECDSNKICNRLILACGNKVNTRRDSKCMDHEGPFPYGIYEFAIPVISLDSIASRISYSNLWGHTSYSTMGNVLEPTSEILEVILSCSMVIIGLLLFTTLMGNIQFFLFALAGRATKMQVWLRDMEWWMNRRQLPYDLRKRVRHFETRRWYVMRGQDDMDMVKDLPEGLRRDIKRHLCLDLIKKAPFFESMDDVILDNICDRVTYFVFSKGEKIIREGDPVQRMVFLVHGRVKRTQRLGRGMVATSKLGPGSFFGDELLTWSLRIPYIFRRFPAATATFTCVKPTEAFALEAKDLRYITNHFRYTFVNEKMKRRARYYSSNWRTWAAINIQLAWRDHASRTRRNATVYTVGDSDRLRHYAAMFMSSFKPHDHLD